MSVKGDLSGVVDMVVKQTETDRSSSDGGTAKGKYCNRAVIRRYTGNEDALKTALKILKLLCEDSGGDKHWKAGSAARK